ncbi:MAG: permease, partial [Desulfobacteraceae bacterium]|nr:permease [Desulfobacteraceae bacterium]
VPLYIRAESAIPIGLALAEKGMSMGAVIALIIGGAGMAIPEMTMLAGIFKKRLVASFVFVVFATAVIGGYAFNMIL